MEGKEDGSYAIVFGYEHQDKDTLLLRHFNGKAKSSLNDRIFSKQFLFFIQQNHRVHFYFFNYFCKMVVDGYPL